MAKEYIERDKIALTDFEIATCGGDYKEGLKLLLNKIEHLPAADVRPVVRGRWIESYSGWTPTKKCSACDVHFTQFPMKTVVKGEPIKPVLNFCPNCGADCREVQDG